MASAPRTTQPPGNRGAGGVSFSLDKPNPELFDQTAMKIAESFDRRKDKSAQLRRFYDELVMWYEKARQDSSSPQEKDKKVNQILPLVRMMNAKAAYAQGRDLVSEEFSDKFFSRGLRQITNYETLENFKLLFEAVLGFRKSMEKRGKGHDN